MAEIPEKEKRASRPCEAAAGSHSPDREIQGRQEGDSFSETALFHLTGNMKILRVLAGIESDIVYHAGRHSFASLITLGDGVPIETISKMLGHSNIQTTQIYARVTPANCLRT